MKHGCTAVSRRESELIHAALVIELGDVIKVAEDEDVTWDQLIPYLKELRRQIGNCDEKQCRVNKRALALVLRKKARR